MDPPDDVAAGGEKFVPEPIDLNVGDFGTMGADNFDGKGTLRMTVLTIDYVPPPRTGGSNKDMAGVYIKFEAANFGQTPVEVNFGDYFVTEDGERYGDGIGVFPSRESVASELNVGETSTGWSLYRVPAEAGYIVEEDEMAGMMYRIPVDPNA